MPDIRPSIFDAGHFYSPIVDPASLDPSVIWHGRTLSHGMGGGSFWITVK